MLGLRARARELRHQPIKTRVLCLLQFGYPVKDFYTTDGKEKLTLGDLSNLAQVVEDALETAGIVENDFYLIPYHYDRVPTEDFCVNIELWSHP